MSDTTRPIAADAGDSSGPADFSYHDLCPFVRQLFAAAIFRGSSAVTRIPGMYKLSWPVGPVLLYTTLLGAGVWAALFLAALTANNDDTAWMSAVPLALFLMEFLAVPVIKFQPCLGKTAAAVRAFTATNRKAEDSFNFKVNAWGPKEYFVCLLLLASATVKVGLLINYGVYLPVALLLGNYAVVAAEFAAHMGGVTSKVPFFVLGKLINSIHQRFRLSEAAAQAEAHGNSELTPLGIRIFPFDSEVVIPEDGVGGHEVRSLGDGHYEVHAAGTITDEERDTFLYRTKNFHSRMALARALAAAQLEQLHAAEMRPGRVAKPQVVPTSPSPVADEPLAEI